METKVCKVCGRELPEVNFRISRWGGRIQTCNECVKAARRETRTQNYAKMGGGKSAPFSDPDFDGKDPGEVVRLMGRAKRWLESRGFEITLRGQYKEVKIRELKF